MLAELQGQTQIRIVTVNATNFCIIGDVNYC